jgi:hypothetical protein
MAKLCLSFCGQRRRRERSVLQRKAFADVMEDRIKTDPTLRQPFDAAVKYVKTGVAPKLHAHVEAYSELTERLIVDSGIKEDEVAKPPVNMP